MMKVAEKLKEARMTYTAIVQENHENIIPVANNMDEIKIGYYTNRNLIFFGYIRTHV
jgi:hypothetical protein